MRKPILLIFLLSTIVAIDLHARIAELTGRRSHVAPQFGQFPARFEPNLGQADPTAHFIARTRQYTLLIQPAAATIALRAGQSPDGDPLLRMVGMDVLNANPLASVQSSEPLPGRSNYFRGADPAQWRSEVPQFQNVAVRSIYPGIDMIYRDERGLVEFSFVVAPDAAQDMIELGFRGAVTLTVSGTGELLLRLPEGELRLSRPVAYEEAENQRVVVAARYEVRDGNRVKIHVEGRDPKRRLVIDPVISYSSFLGGTSGDGASGIAVDGAGSAFVTGLTWSLNFPLSGPFQNTLRGENDVFVVKIHPSGTQLLYSTYLGSRGRESAGAIAIDSQGNAYVTGDTSGGDSYRFGFSTGPADFPLVNPIKTCKNEPIGYNDIYVVKLSPVGSALVYSTCLGGPYGQSAYAIAVDGNGQAHIAGRAYDGFPTVNAIQPTWGGQTDAVVVKLNASGTAMLYATFLGGSEHDSASGIAVDGSGNVTVTGTTISRNFPVFAAFQSVHPGNSGNPTGFVARLNATGAQFVYSTYMGASGWTEANSVAVDATGSAFVSGTSDYGFPTTSGAIQPGFPGHAWSCFAAKLTPAGGVSYATYFGNVSSPRDCKMGINSAGKVYLIGSTIGRTVPLVSTIGDGATSISELFISVLDATLSRVIFSTLLGASPGQETAGGIAVDSSGNVYYAGDRVDNGMPVVNAFQPVFAGAGDAMVGKITPADSCTYALSTESITYPPLGGSAFISVTAPSSCKWNVALGRMGATLSGPVVNPLTISSLAGTTTWNEGPSPRARGNGTITVNVGATSAGLPTRSFLVIAGRRVDVIQLGHGCRYNEVNGFVRITAAATTRLFPTGASSDCPVQAVSTASWISIQSTGSGMVTFAVAENTSPSARVGIIYIEGVINTILQDGTTTCPYSVALSSTATVPFRGEERTVSVTTQPGCAWGVGNTSSTVDSRLAIVFPEGTTRIGSGTLRFRMLPNPSTTSRSAYVIVAAQEFYLSQAAGPLSARPEPDFSSPVMPFAGIGSAQSFTLKFRDPDGWSDITSARLLINVALAASNACYLEFFGQTNRVRLLMDDGETWSTAAQGGTSGVLQNSQCAVDASGVQMTGSADLLTVSVPLTFKPAFQGRRMMYMRAFDQSGLAWPEWLTVGAWWPGSFTGSFVNRYRLYNPFSRSHLHTTDANEYNVLGASGFLKEGISGQILNGPGSAGGTAGVPYYRIYNIPGQRHFWTADRNEYLTLIRYTGIYLGELVDGFVLPTAASGMIPLYRLVFCCASPVIHHWTTDAYEYSVLGASGGWTQEGVAGYMGPANAGMSSLRLTSNPVRITAVVHGATNQSGPVAPGQLIRLVGENFGHEGMALADGMPMQVVSWAKDQIVAVIPEFPAENIAIEVVSGEARSDAEIVNLIASRPAILGGDEFGRGQVSLGDGVSAGGTMTLLLTGEGRSGATFRATVGRFSAEVIGAEKLTERPGVSAVQIRVPENIRPGNVPVVVTVGESPTQPGVLVGIR